MPTDRFYRRIDKSSTSLLKRRVGNNPVAIVGLGSIFPCARNTAEFWNNILGKVDCITDIPESHWSVTEYYDPDTAAPDKTYCKRGGFIPEVPFNPLEFGMPPGDLEVTDVIQVLSLIVAKQVLADAGCPEADWYDASRTGVSLGVTGANALIQPLSARLQVPLIKEVVRSCGLTESDADEITRKYVLAFAPWQENSFPGVLGNVVAGRIANRFDLGGINFTADAACASSLVAVRMAVHELLSGNADLMITGGCDAENTILTYLCFSKTRAFSKSGVIRPFDENGDGTLIGEGIGMLALKRLEDAERDGDRIYAVLRGIGASSDGRFKSIYAPRADGQATALRRAYADAGLGVDQMALLECHGTGTAVGETTELTALGQVFGGADSPSRSVAIGSVKSQIGHTKGAAGAASMIKVALALHQKVLPPTINVENPHPVLRDDSSPFYVNTEARPWLADPNRPVRRAGVSSFGFGGTNFHCVLEEHPGEVTEVLHRTAQVYLWHAPTPEKLLAALGGAPTDSEIAVPAGHARAAVVATDRDEANRLRDELARRLGAQPPALEALDLPQGAYYRRQALLPGKVAALFAGQGAQYVGMGTQAAIAVPPVRAAFDAAAQQCTGGRPLGLVVFPPPSLRETDRAGQEAALQATEYAQPAIGALSAGQYRYLAELGFTPDGALGHSFGELTALWAAGSLGDGEFYRLARRRGVAMAARPRDLPDAGAMAAVTADLPTVQRLLMDHPGVEVCNNNAPDQIVVGGGTAAVSDFITAAADAGIQARQLPVAAAFHTRYVAHAVNAFAECVHEVTVRAPQFCVFANTAGANYGENVEVNAQTLVRQLVNAVSFAERVQQMYAEGYRVFIEFGPRSVLAGLVRNTLASADDIVVLSADAGPNSDSDCALKQLAARLAVLGLPLVGFNRFTVQREMPERGNGMTIMLNGANYVPEERRREYRIALENGYRVVGAAAPAATAQAAPLGAPPQVVPASELPMAQPAFSTRQPAQVSGLAVDHLGMHREYLDSQLRIADRISTLVQREAERQTGPQEALVDGIRAITEHCVAIGHSHAQASEVLRSFVQLAAGAPGSTPTGYRSAQEDYVPVQEESTGDLPVPADMIYELDPAPATMQAGVAPPSVVPVPALTPPPAPAPSVRTNADAVQGALLDVVSARTGYPADMLELGMDVEADLGIDSIKRVEIMGALREQFPSSMQAKPEDLGRLRTLQQIIDFVVAASETSAVAETEDVHAGPKEMTEPSASRVGSRG